ncbi:MAG TPA: hypothetical protein VF310_17270, partial [Vicinamibacteria bacterium]
MTTRRSGGVITLLLCLTAAARAQEGVEAEEAARQAALKALRAEAILAREEGGRPLDAAFRAEVKARLAASSPEALEAVEKRGYGLLPGPQALGDATADLVYTPVAPCRIVDTRLAGGALAAGSQRNFVVGGSVGFAAQGGSPSGCGVPLGPTTGAVINFVAVNPSGAGNLRAWAYGGTVPNASIINYAALGMNIANAVVVPLCDFSSATCTPADITVQADVSAAHLVADVVGYFRSVVKAQYRSFTVAAVQSDVLAVLPATGCSNAVGPQVTVVAPVAGRIVVQARAIYNLSHTTGTGDQIHTFIGTSATDCPAQFGWADITYVHTTQPSAVVNTTAHATRIFDVAAGTYTYFLNSRQVTGGGSDRIDHGLLVATVEPNGG